MANNKMVKKADAKVSKKKVASKNTKGTKTTKNQKMAIGVGVGAGLLAAGAAGYYFFASDNAKKNRKIAATWASNLKKDVEAEVRNLAEQSKDAVDDSIEKVVATYTGIEGVTTRELKAAGAELKRNWKKLVK